MRIIAKVLYGVTDMRPFFEYEDGVLIGKAEVTEKNREGNVVSRKIVESGIKLNIKDCPF